MDEALISRVPLFSTLPPAEIRHLATTLRRVHYPAGTILFQEGEYGDWFGIVLQGQIAIVKGLGSPHERLIGLRGPGEFLGEMSLLNEDGSRTATVWVTQDAEFLQMTRAEFDALLARNSSLAYTMLRVQSSRLRDAQEAAMQDLRERNQRLAQAYADLEAAQAQLTEQEALARELRLASEIQASMLPETLPHLAGFDTGARMIPAQSVGGDFYDLFRLGPDRLGITIGDVSGKGMPAALVMALTCTLLRVEARRATSPAEALQQVNRHLVERNSQGMFVTAVYGVLDRITRQFTYVRAGHEFPLAYDETGTVVMSAEVRSLPLGFSSDPPLHVETVTLSPGSTVLLYTDGVTEAMNDRRELFGSERLCEMLPARRGESAQALCDRLVEAVVSYRGETPQSDDITVLAISSLS